MCNMYVELQGQMSRKLELVGPLQLLQVHIKATRRSRNNLVLEYDVHMKLFNFKVIFLKVIY